MMKNTILSLALILVFAASTLAFAPTSTLISSRASTIHNNHGVVILPQDFTSTTTQLQERKYDGVDDGIGRGIYIQVVVFAICAWLFTIPPEFRRAYLCPADTFCQEPGSCTKECVTTKEWVDGVKEYYKNGGGIQWDFSIDPKTKAMNQKKLDAILGNMNNGNWEMDL